MKVLLYLFRYKRRKKKKVKLIKKRPRPSSTETDVNIESTSSDSDVPLSTLATKRKQLKKFKKALTHLFKNPKTDAPQETKDRFANDLRHLPTTVNGSNSLPSCSRYSTDTDNCLDLSMHNRHSNEDSSGSIIAPTCSKYAYSSSRSSLSADGTNSCTVSINVMTPDQSSSEDDYPLRHLVKSEIREVRPDPSNGEPSSSSTNNKYSGKRLRKICIKKEEPSNMWYSYPNPALSDSSN